MEKNGWRRKILRAFCFQFGFSFFLFLFSIRAFLFSIRAFLLSIRAFLILTSLKQESADTMRPILLLEPSVRRSHLSAQDPKRISLNRVYADISLSLFIMFTIPQWYRCKRKTEAPKARRQDHHTECAINITYFKFTKAANQNLKPKI